MTRNGLLRAWLGRVEEYGPKVEATLEAHGGKYIVRTTEMEKLE